MFESIDAFVTGASVVMLVILVIALVGAAVRMIVGPGYADRFVALDMLTGIAVAACALTAAVTLRRGIPLMWGSGVALIAFLATVALALLPREEGKEVLMLALLAFLFKLVGVGLSLRGDDRRAALRGSVPAHACLDQGRHARRGPRPRGRRHRYGADGCRHSRRHHLFFFLLATLPVAGHLLGRAFVYFRCTAGKQRRCARRRAATLRGAARSARRGCLRAPDGVDAGRRNGPCRRCGKARYGTQGRRRRTHSRNPAMTRSVFAIFGPDAKAIARRAETLAHARSVPLSGIAVIDEDCITRAKVPDPGEVIRSALAGTLAETQGVTAESRVPFSLTYEEGDPLTLIPACDAQARELLLLPCEGWCDHGADLGLPAGESRPGDKLFALAERHAGATLFIGTAQASGPVAILHDGSDAFAQPCPLGARIEALGREGHPPHRPTERRTKPRQSRLSRKRTRLN